MTITQLKYVLAVAEYKNFTLAADKCFVTQPTLSMQIQKIEEELNIQIFDRTKKPIQLTDIGQKIVTQAKSIVNEADRIQDIVEQQKGFIGGEFRLGIIPTIMPTLLPMDIWMRRLLQLRSKKKKSKRLCFTMSHLWPIFLRDINITRKKKLKLPI
jgi:DNA-binding transcriptional LysR family regulator